MVVMMMLLLLLVPSSWDRGSGQCPVADDGIHVGGCPSSLLDFGGFTKLRANALVEPFDSVLVLDCDRCRVRLGVSYKGKRAPAL